jgi:hypothetical protein
MQRVPHLRYPDIFWCLPAAVFINDGATPLEMQQQQQQLLDERYVST